MRVDVERSQGEPRKAHIVVSSFVETCVQDYVLSVGVTPDGNWVASGSKDRSIQFWNIQSGQAQLMLQGHKNSGELCPSASHILCVSQA